MVMSRMLMAGGDFVLNITSNAVNPNIKSLAETSGWNGSGALIVNISAPLINTLDLGAVAFPGGITLNISAATRIGGVRGLGSAGTFALKTRVPVTINNQGVISGGGGGGANGSSCWVRYQTTSGTTNSAGGAGGSGQGFQDANSLVVVTNTGGSSGVTNTYEGSVLGGQTRPWARGGTGGAGGVWGANGGVGEVGTVGGSYAESSQPPYLNGYPAGPAVDGNSYITWLAAGTRQGPLI